MLIDELESAEESYNDFAFWRRRPLDLNARSQADEERDEESASSELMYWRRRPSSLVGTGTSM